MEYEYVTFAPNKRNRKLVKTSFANINRIGVQSGDVVIVEKDGKRTAAKILPQDEHIKYVSIDPVIKKTLNLNIGDKITISKPTIACSVEGEIIFSYSDNIEDYESIIINAITTQYMHSPLMEGDEISISISSLNSSFVLKVQYISSPIIIVSKEIEIKFKSSKHIIDIQSVNLDCIGGLSKVKEMIKNRIVLPLEHPEIFRYFENIQPPKGVLLYGPPGTGKTMMMKSIASQIKNCNFIEISSSDIFSRYYGDGENEIKKIFEEARSKKPTIIFIDEIDSIATKRDDGTGQMEKRLVGKILSEMDGIKRGDGVIVIGSTNRPNSIDEAFRRTGRFDYEIEFEPPNSDDRLEILKIHTSQIKLDKVDLKLIASKTHGYVGSDLYGIVKEAIIQCIERNSIKLNLNREIPTNQLSRISVNMNDFESAIKMIRPSSMREIENFIDEEDTEIIGMEECKKCLEESVIWKLTPPEKIKNLVSYLPSNVLLYGPPGTGKTSIVKYIAKQSGVNFFYIKAPEIMVKWVGESAQNVKNIFSKAKRSQPSIIFIDEIDAITSDRDGTERSSTAQVLAQLLIEIELSKNEKISVIAATNQPYLVDQALIRSGRFDYHICTQLPSDEEKEKLFSHFLSIIPHENFSIKELIKNTTDFVASDIKLAVRLAISEFARTKSEILTLQNMMDGIKRVSPSCNKESLKRYESFKNRDVIIKSDLYS